ncbi:hypothetical protein LCGC14_2893120, partial [marine sediment metagenome]
MPQLPEYITSAPWGPVYEHVNDCDECTGGDPCKEGLQAVQNTGNVVGQQKPKVAAHWVGLIAGRI